MKVKIKKMLFYSEVVFSSLGYLCGAIVLIGMTFPCSKLDSFIFDVFLFSALLMLLAIYVLLINLYIGNRKFWWLRVIAALIYCGLLLLVYLIAP